MLGVQGPARQHHRLSRASHAYTDQHCCCHSGLRSQHKNRAQAWQILRARLAQQRRDAREEELARLRVSVIGVAKMGRGDKVRTYNWSQQRVTDHRSGITVHHLDDILQGGESLDQIMASVKGWLTTRDVEGLIADEEAARAKSKHEAKRVHQRG